MFNIIKCLYCYEERKNMLEEKPFEGAQATAQQAVEAEARQAKLLSSKVTFGNTEEFVRSVNASFATVRSFAEDLERARNDAAHSFSLLANQFSITPSQKYLEDQLYQLKQKINTQANALKEKDQNIAEREKRIEEMAKTFADLEEKRSLQFLLDRVRPDLHEKLVSSEKIKQQFLESKECTAYVISIDIRRSTELMLKATSPEEFANFITGLCGELSDIVKINYGVYDKFTGDGILAFFPEFFSGTDAGYYALQSAVDCHNAFKARYDSSRHIFNSVIKDIGLGIGIDFGVVKLVQMAGGLTVVGSPVVYACRFGNAPAGITLLNHPAYKRIYDKYGAHIHFEETEIPIKHEGNTLAYKKVKFGSSPYTPKSPDWLGAQEDIS